MSKTKTKTSAELFDDFIKNKWQDTFRRDVDVRRPTGGRFVPNAGVRGIRLLHDDVNAFDEAIRMWSVPEDELPTQEGIDLIVEQAGAEYTWEGILIDPSRPWAADVPPLVRDRIKADLERRAKETSAHVKARDEEAEREASDMDGEVIAYMNAKRVEEGKPALTAEQEASVRESRRSRRAERLGRS